MKSWDVLDYLDSCKCFLNGLNGRPAHMESYMTVLDFNALEKALKEAPFSDEDLEVTADSLHFRAYLSPINELTALQIDKFLKSKNNVIATENNIR